MQGNDPTGLRERKKAETRLAIERVAVEIACDQGYEAATAEAIAAGANVSLRTFFNYFPSKDVAIVGQGLILVDEARAHRILEESGNDLLKGIARVAEECVAQTDPQSALMHRRRGLIHKNPSLFHLHMMAIDRFEGSLATAVADHLRVHPSRRRLSNDVTVEEEARLAVGVVSAAVRHQVLKAIEQGVDVATSEDDIERIIDMMADIQRKEL